LPAVTQAQANQDRLHKQALAEATAQGSANQVADTKAQAACGRLGGVWYAPGTTTFTASNGTTFEIMADPSAARCTEVPYLGSDDSTYRIEVTFNSDGSPQFIGPGNSVVGATQSECQRGYFPDQSAGRTSQPPGNWSSVLGLCLPPSG
jgi:hypothetical protein